MTEYQLRVLIYDLYCNSPRLRELASEGVLKNKDLWDMQDKAVELAKKDGLIS